MIFVTFSIELTPEGFTAFAPERNLFLRAATRQELFENARLATAQQFAATGDSSAYIMRWQWEFRHFFAVNREIKHGALAAIISMNASLLSQYITGAKVPSRKQKDRVMRGIHQLAAHLLQMKIG